MIQTEYTDADIVIINKQMLSTEEYDYMFQKLHCMLFAVDREHNKTIGFITPKALQTKKDIDDETSDLNAFIKSISKTEESKNAIYEYKNLKIWILTEN